MTIRHQEHPPACRTGNKRPRKCSRESVASDTRSSDATGNFAADKNILGCNRDKIENEDPVRKKSQPAPPPNAPSPVCHPDPLSPTDLDYTKESYAWKCSDVRFNPLYGNKMHLGTGVYFQHRKTLLVWLLELSDHYCYSRHTWYVMLKASHLLTANRGVCK